MYPTMIVDHALNLSRCNAEWAYICTLGASPWMIYRNASGWWMKSRPGGHLGHLQALSQVWDLFIDSGQIPPQQLVNDTVAWKAAREQAEAATARPATAGKPKRKPRPAKKKEPSK